MVGYDNFQSNFGLVFEHEHGKEIEHSLGGRMIINQPIIKKELSGIQVR